MGSRPRASGSKFGADRLTGEEVEPGLNSSVGKGASGQYVTTAVAGVDTTVGLAGGVRRSDGVFVQIGRQGDTGGLEGAADLAGDGGAGGDALAVVYIVESLKSKGLVEQERHPDPSSPATAGYRLTFDGWARFATGGEWTRPPSGPAPALCRACRAVAGPDRRAQGARAARRLS